MHGAHIQGGPFDVTKILAADRHGKAGQPVVGSAACTIIGANRFKYYLTRDETVFSDAGIRLDFRDGMDADARQAWR